LDAALKTIKGPDTQPIYKSLDDYADFRRLLAYQLEILADMNSLTQDIHVNTDFTELLDRIQSLRSSGASHRRRMPDAEFQRTMRARIREVLDLRTNLRDALFAKVREVLGTGTGDPLESLCAADPATAINDILRPATEQCLLALALNSDDHADTWEAAKTVLNWLSMFSVSPVWITHKELSSSEPDPELEIMVNTSCGVEIVSARYRQMPPKLRAEQGKSEVRGGDSIEFPRLETGWSQDAALDRLFLEIWTRVFPEETRHRLDESDLRTLNAALLRRDKNKTHHYYLLVKEGDPLSRPGFHDRLLQALSAIRVITLKSSGKTPALQVEDEFDLMTVIREFLTIPHTRRSRI
jgi:hypothetical protein